MSYSESLKVFWFTPMRAATRSCGVIMKRFDFTELSHEFIKNKLHEQYYLVSNIRNPYSRLVSIYYLYLTILVLSLFCLLKTTNFNNYYLIIVLFLYYVVKLKNIYFRKYLRWSFIIF